MSSLIVPIVKISSVEKHPNADTLSIVKFEGYGWQSLIKTGQYKVGDLAIFVPPDSILPQWIIDLEKIEYLRNENGRTRSVKLRGEMSHGILLPPDILPLEKHDKIGDNIAEKLGIVKWEAPEPEYLTRGQWKEKKAKKKNPTFPVYTKIEKVEFFPGQIDLGEKVWISEKIHGTNFRAGWAMKTEMSFVDRIKKLFGKYNPFYFTCGSHKVEMGLDAPKKSWYDKVVEWNVYQRTAQQIKDKIPVGYIVYGEIYGNKIQDLTYGLTDKTSFVIFDVMDTTTGKYLDYLDMLEFLGDCELLEYLVPILYAGPFNSDLIQMYTSGTSWLSITRQIREGIVIKPCKERFDPLLGRVVLKSISPEYLTRKNGTEYN